MQSRPKVLAALARHENQMLRTAAGLPPQFGGDDDESQGGFPHPPGPGQAKLSRDIPEGHDYDPKALKPIAKMLWAMSVALGHAMTAHRQFTKLKSSTVSPDGLLGGKGYVMSVKDVRKQLYDACEALSAISDTIHDEINAPHWKPKLAQLEKEESDRIQNLVNDAEHMLDNPEEEVEEEEKEVEKGHAPWHHPAVDKENKRKNKDPKSQVPDGGDLESNPRAEPFRNDQKKTPGGIKEASKAPSYFRAVVANSSVPVESLPGPRVEHLDRGDTDQTGPFGTYNQDEPQKVDDPWSRDQGQGNDYAYPSGWDNDLHEKEASDRGRIFKAAISQLLILEAAGALPDANTDSTPTEGFDFGIGDGNGNDAHGQGAGGYGTGNPGAPDSNPGGGTGNMGVYGPSSGLPKDPGGTLNPSESDSTPTVENEISGRGRYAYRRTAQAELPQDAAPSVARSDYYQGEKGDNMLDTAPSNVGSTKLPGEQIPAKLTPTTARPSHNEEHMFATGGLPGDGTTVDQERDRDLGPNKTDTVEQVNTPYIRWDNTTPEMRPDFTYQRDPVQGPYVHNDLAERPDNG